MAKQSDGPNRIGWTREQQLAVLWLYTQLSFGKIDRNRREIISLANKIGRTPNAVAMKALNFASLDPLITKSGRKGLTGASNADRQLWAEFQTDSERIAEEAETLAEQLHLTPASNPSKAHGPRPVRQSTLNPLPSTLSRRAPTGPTDALQLTKVRRVQAFFRRAVLASYDSTCAITGLKLRPLLRASHILPWSTHPTRRADPTNGLCLSALFDAAFDRGFITIDEDLRVIVSKRLAHAAKSARLPCSITEAHRKPLILPPHRQPPDREALNHHRSAVFRN